MFTVYHVEGFRHIKLFFEMVSNKAMPLQYMVHWLAVQVNWVCKTKTYINVALIHGNVCVTHIT